MDEISKSDFRGRRNINNKTVKRNVRHKFDDDRDMVVRKEAGKRKHSSVGSYDVVYEESDYEDEPYAGFCDPKLIK